MSPEVTIRTLRTFARDRAGNTAMIFGLAIIPFFGILAMATDYSLALADKAKLDGATDAAGLAAIRVAQSAIQGGASRPAAMAAGTAQALATFRANAGTLALAAAPVPSVTWVAGATGQTLTTSISYATTMSNTFTRIIGFQTTKIANLSHPSVATLTMPSYINYYIITDASQSMGVGATATDMTNLYNRVIQFGNYDTATNRDAKIGCVFGCHVAESMQADTNENLAHNTAKYGLPYINLRIDSAKSAIQSILSDALTASQQSNPNIVKIGVYTMQQNPNTGSVIQTIVDPPNASFTATSTTVANQIDLGSNNPNGFGDSGFANSLNYFSANLLSTQGDGSSAGSPLNFVFLITDGLTDLCNNSHCTNAFDESICTQISAKATVGVIYTTYNPIYYKNDSSQGLQQDYKNLAANYVPSIPGNLRACAKSTSFYYEASDGPSITLGMKALFQSAASASHLSQ